MDEEHIPDFRRQFKEWSADIMSLRQNPLLPAGRFVTFAKDRGIPVSGAITGNPGTFFAQEWLPADSSRPIKTTSH
jgi:hypothetical protein